MPRQKIIACLIIGLFLSSVAFADRSLATHADVYMTLSAGYLDKISDRIQPQLLELGLNAADIDAIVEDAAFSVTGCVLSKMREPDFRYNWKFVVALARSDGLADALESIQVEFGDDVARSITASLSSADSQCMSDMFLKRKLK